MSVKWNGAADGPQTFACFLSFSLWDHVPYGVGIRPGGGVKEGMTEETLAHAEIVWQFMQLSHKPMSADLMLVFGTNDLRVATLAADLYLQGLAPLALTTGGI